MNEFIHINKKDYVDVKGILGRLIEMKESKKRDELFQKLKEELASHEGRENHLLSALAGEERDASAAPVQEMKP